MKRAAQAIDRVGMTLLKRRIDQEKKLSCCLLGGMAPFIEPWLSHELRETLVPRKGDANAGAIFLIKREVQKTC
jgi:N-acetylglucosamine kinase-like BadF-type ATPase